MLHNVSFNESDLPVHNVNLCNIPNFQQTEVLLESVFRSLFKDSLFRVFSGPVS